MTGSRISGCCSISAQAVICELTDGPDRFALESGRGRLEWWCLEWNGPGIDFCLSPGAEPMADWTAYRLTGEGLKEMAK